MKKWIIKNRIKQDIDLHSNKLISSLLFTRGITNEKDINKFLYPCLKDMSDPFLLRDMDLAIEKIDSSIKGRNKIIIYGDYDVDGITSTSILYLALKKIGADVSYYIPDRMSEGYGINKQAIVYLNTIGTELIITVDCGISSMEEVDLAKSLGMDIIITDHHECKTIIPDTIVINPKRHDCPYPFKELAGCGVALKLIQALWIRYGLSGFEDFFDIAAIGTVADIVDLKGENRIIVKEGLCRLLKNNRCGIRALKEVSGIGDDITSYNITFQIAPRLNAAGRLSDAKIAVELFITNDYDKALQIAKFLDKENKNRQKIEDNIINDVIDKIGQVHDLKQDRVIVMSSPDWHVGVIGIVASRIVERFNRPVILIGEDGDVGRGSGRSIEGFNLFENISKCSDLLIKFGGHELAAGLSIEISRINDFRKQLNSLARDIDIDFFQEKLNIDMEISTEYADIETVEILKLFEPFGAGNPQPLLYLEGLSVVSKRAIGSSEQHLKLVFEKNGIKYDGIMFRGSKDYFNKNWQLVDIAFNMNINSWNNNINLQFVIKDMRPHAGLGWEGNESSFFKSLKQASNEIIEDYDLKDIKFIRKNIDFLKEFAYFNCGYILVSHINSILELRDLLEGIDFNSNNNIGLSTQIIICPNIELIDFGENDVIIYDFLPGQFEYRELIKKIKGKVYNFYGRDTLEKLEEYFHLVTIEEKNLLKFIQDLMYNEIVGSIDDISKRCSTNVFAMYKTIVELRNQGIVEVLSRDNILKIRLKQKNADMTLFMNRPNRYTAKLKALKNLLVTYIREE